MSSTGQDESGEHNWTLNYFNYFTEIEEHFQRARGTSLFLLSPLDWALAESWKNSEIPLEAVLRGIDAAFEKWRTRKNRTQMVNSLAFCSQAVMAEAQKTPESREQAAAKAQPAFDPEEIRRYLLANADVVRNTQRPEFEEIPLLLGRMAEQEIASLEQLEQQLSVLEEKLIAIARATAKADEALEARRDLEAQLRPYRGKMTAPQLAMLEKQYLERWVLERNKLPRLSLFYLR